MSSDHKLFHKITLRGKPLSECKLVYQGKNNHTRMYMAKHFNYFNDIIGFFAYAVNWVGGVVVDDDWDHHGIKVETVFQVSAYSYGIYNLEFNATFGGFDINIPELIEMLQKVRELELEFCRDAE